MTSSIQDALWFADRLAPDSPAGHLVRAYRVTGALDHQALGVAWRHVLARHEILRTTLDEADGRPVPRVAAVGNKRDGFASVRLSGPGADAVFARWYAERAVTPNALAAGPPARLTVVGLAAAEHGVVLALHRSVADVRSLSVVVEELSWAYTQVMAGHRPVLGAEPRQYAEYARRQRRFAGTPAFAERTARWVSRLERVPPRLDLPFDRVRPAEVSWHAAGEPFGWNDGLARHLARFAADAGTRAHVVVLAAFLILLRRHAGTGRLAVTVPVPVLPDPAFDRIVGPCVNPVVVAVDLAAKPTFRAAVGHTAAALRAAVDHGDVPLAEVVRSLALDRDPRRTPFGDAVFVPRTPAAALRLAGAVVRSWPVATGATDADLALEVDPIGSSVTGELRYRTALVDAAAARKFLRQLRVLLESGLAGPDTGVDRLALEDAAEIRAAVAAGDRIAAAAAPAHPVHELVRRGARERPAAIAVEDEHEALTYRELDRRVAALTVALCDGGTVSGHAVAVRMPAGAGLCAAVLAVFRAGARLVCLEAGEVGERGRAVLAGLRPVRLLVGGAAAHDEVTRWYRDEQGGRVIETARVDPGAGAALEPGAVDVGATAYIAYTSGSTGRPKGIPQTHAALTQFSGWFADAFRIGPGARVAQWAAPAYDASLCEMSAALTAGATLCVVPERIRVNPDKMVDWLVRERITLLQTVPSFARELLAAAGRRDAAARLAGLDHLLLAGEALPGELAAELRTAFPGARLVNLYGTTESILSTWHEVTRPAPGPVPVGRPIPGRQILVLDEHDQPCATGVTGQIVVHSPYVTCGYVGVADDPVFRDVPPGLGLGTAAGRWHRTGDLGRRRWDGLLECRGRRDQQIKINGIRLELEEIEAVLGAQPTVADCAVVAVTGPHGRVVRLVAYVVTPDAGQVDAWRSAVCRHLGAVRMPVVFRMVPSLPRNGGGKIDRGRLPDPGAAGSGPVRPLRPPVEPVIAGIWDELLGGRHRDPYLSFTAAGGHSLLVPVLLSRIRRRYGTEVPLAAYYADPTIAGLAGAVRDRPAPRSARPEPAEPGKPKEYRV